MNNAQAARSVRNAPTSRREHVDYWKRNAQEGSERLREALRPLLRDIAVRKAIERKAASA